MAGHDDKWENHQQFLKMIHLDFTYYLNNTIRIEK